LTGLVKKIEKRLGAAAGKGPRPAGVFVIFDSKTEGLDKQLRALAEKKKLQHISLCIGPPPEDYEVSKDADITVVIYKIGKRRGEKVLANFALRKGELDKAKSKEIVKALSDVLPK
jgi:hypothetical protein